MINNIFTGQPSWLIAFCLLLAGIYSFVLYFRERQSEFPLYLKVLLGTTRFVAVFLISFLLLSPFFRSITREKEKPVIILAVDNSQSLLINPDSSKYREEFPAAMENLAKRISAIGEVRKYVFDRKLQPIPEGVDFPAALNFKGQVTDISGMITDLENLYTNLNVGALILASDGIYNTGSNPLYTARDWPYPLYTVALGDTSTRMDLILSRVNFNRMVFLNNRFMIEVVVRAIDAAGYKSKVSILQENKLLQSQDFTMDNNDVTRSFQFILDAKNKGLQKFTITIDPLEGELSLANNRKEIFIEVLDSRNKVLLIAAAPHPDVSALSQAIKSNINYEVEERLAGDFTGKVEDYGLVILHQVPSAKAPAENILREIDEKKVPVLYILGSQTDFPRFNQQYEGLKITTSPRAIFDESVPWINPGFTSFSLTENTVSWLADLPPLVAPLGDYQVANASRILLKQRIGSVETTRPLILFNETLDGRSGVITGEGIWKWKLFDFARNKDHQAFNELINKIVQYLSLKEQKKNFRVYYQTNFRETEPVVFDAEVYDESYELTIEPEVEIIIRNEEDKQFPFVFNKAGNAYHLDAGIFPPGSYSFDARAQSGNNTYEASGRFSVSATDLEALHTVADHQLLFQLAESGGGKMFHASELDLLADDILAREDIRPVAYTRKKYEELLNKSWLLAVILGLLTLEWFMRKRAGSY